MRCRILTVKYIPQYSPLQGPLTACSHMGHSCTVAGAACHIVPAVPNPKEVAALPAGEMNYHPGSARTSGRRRGKRKVLGRWKWLPGWCVPAVWERVSSHVLSPAVLVSSTLREVTQQAAEQEFKAMPTQCQSWALYTLGEPFALVPPATEPFAVAANILGRVGNPATWMRVAVEVSVTLLCPLNKSVGVRVPTQQGEGTGRLPL